MVWKNSTKKDTISEFSEFSRKTLLHPNWHRLSTRALSRTSPQIHCKAQAQCDDSKPALREMLVLHGTDVSLILWTPIGYCQHPSVIEHVVLSKNQHSNCSRTPRTKKKGAVRSPNCQVPGRPEEAGHLVQRTLRPPLKFRVISAKTGSRVQSPRDIRRDRRERRASMIRSPQDVPRHAASSAQPWQSLPPDRSRCAPSQHQRRPTTLKDPCGRSLSVLCCTALCCCFSHFLSW